METVPSITAHRQTHSSSSTDFETPREEDNINTMEEGTEGTSTTLIHKNISMTKLITNEEKTHLQVTNQEAKDSKIIFSPTPFTPTNTSTIQLGEETAVDDREMNKKKKAILREERKKLARQFPSRNVLLCSGRIILGADWRRLISTIVLILIPFIVFMTFITSYFYLINTAAGIVLTVFPMLAIAYVYFALCITSVMDPGILPRRSIVFNNLSEESQDAEDFEEKFVPENQHVYVKGKMIQMKYCYTCRIYRPPRSSHCSQCDNCVEKFDHHCPWTGTCIGKRNYRPFMHFVSSATISLLAAIGICVFQIVWSCYKLITHPFVVSGRVVWEIIATIVSLPLIIYSAGALSFVGALCLFHLHLITKGRTTNEHLKMKRGVKSDFNRGFFSNWLPEYLCAACEPSLIPFRRPLSEYHVITRKMVEDNNARHSSIGAL